MTKSDKELVKELTNEPLEVTRPVIITILGKNDVGKSIFSTITGKPQDTLYVVCDSNTITPSLENFKEFIPNIAFIESMDMFSKIASKIDKAKQSIIVLDHIGGLVTRTKSEFTIPCTDPTYHFKLGAHVSKKVAQPLIDLIHRCRNSNKILVMLCPLTFSTKDDLSEGDVAFDTKTAQEIIFNESDLILYLKKKNKTNNIEEFLTSIEVITNLETSIFPLKDKANFLNRPYATKYKKSFIKILQQTQKTST